MKELKSKVAIVTGASRGVGKSISYRLAEEGCHVVLAARTEGEINEISEEISRKGGSAFPVVTDVTQENDVLRLIQTVKKEFDTVDILINNAGIGKYGSLEDLSIEDYDDMMNTNMRSTFLCSKHVFPEMKMQRSGFIINVASVAGLRGLPNETVYCATKHAQVGFAQALDYEARQYGIKVGNVCPGGINTTFAFGEGRSSGDPHLENFLAPEDVADAVAFILLQPEKSRIIDVTMRPMSETL
jgi:NADP-dependent 3-hydroxy acid dehydrogenase YdfG